MRNINVTLSDREYDWLVAIKTLRGDTWHEFLMEAGDIMEAERRGDSKK